MDSAEIIWNLKRLIRDAFPKGLPLRQLEPQYKKYFQCQLPAPSRIEPGSTNWEQVLQKPDRFKKWFKVDKKNVIKVAPIPERDLRVYFRLVRYTQYISTRQGAKHDGWSGLSESEEDQDSDDETRLIANLTNSNDSFDSSPATGTATVVKKKNKPVKKDEDESGHSKSESRPSPKKRKLGLGPDEGSLRRVTVSRDKNWTNNEDIEQLTRKARHENRLERNRLAESKSKDGLHAIMKRLQSMYLATECKICCVNFDSDIVQSRVTHYKSRDHFQSLSSWLKQNGVVVDLKPEWEEITWRYVWRYGRREQPWPWENSCRDLLTQASELFESKGLSYSTLVWLRCAIVLVQADLENGNYASPSELASALRARWNLLDKRYLKVKLMHGLNQLFGKDLDQIIKDFETAAAAGDYPEPAQQPQC